MATLDEIFASMPEEAAEGVHDLLIIDPEARTIDVPDTEKIFGVENDGRAETKYFQAPRYVGHGIDLAACFLRVNFQNANGDRDGYLVNDLAISGDYVLFSWELSKKVTQYKGAVQFVICANLPGSTKVADWHTTLAQGTVLEGLEPDAAAVEAASSDIIAQLLQLVTSQTAAVEAAGAAQVANVQTEGAAQVDAVKTAAAQAEADALAEIEAKKQNALAQLPADNTAMGNQVDKLTRSTAGAIVCAAEGTTIQVQDASNDPLQGLRIFGKSTQDGTPTPDNPVEIVSPAAPVVSVYGENIFDVSKMDVHANKTLDDADDGATITVTGGGDKPYTSSILQLDVDALRGNTLIVAADSITNTNTAAKGGVQLNVHRGDRRDYEAISAESLTRSLYIGADVTDLYVAIYTNNTSDALGVDNVVTVKGLRLNLNQPAAWNKCAALQTLTITTPGSLPGIPVASGGNYTDANGQQWICDEVDLARGVYVQRVQMEELSIATMRNDGGLYCKLSAGKSKYDTVALCSHAAGGITFANGTRGAYASCVIKKSILPASVTDAQTGQAWLDEQKAAGTPVAVVYVLSEPVETPLTEEELAAWRNLHSVKPTTTILNDAGAHMAVEYVADTKLYIDLKLAEILTAKDT